MALAVFDADVLIGLLDPEDAHHARSTACVRATRDAERRISAVTLSEVLVGPVRMERAGEVERDLARLSITVVPVDVDLARVAARVRAHRRLKVPDALVLATALRAQAQGHEGVRVETFDAVLGRAAREMLGTETT